MTEDFIACAGVGKHLLQILDALVFPLTIGALRRAILGSAALK